VDAALRLGLGHALHAVAAALVLQSLEDLIPLQLRDLDLPSPVLGVVSFGY